MKPKKTKKDILIALKKHLGNVTYSCEEVGISRDTFYRWLREDEEFKRDVESVNDIQIDFVENKLMQKIKEGSDAAIIFFMKHKGRGRGYSDSLDITTNGKDITSIKLIEIKNNNGT